VKTAIGAVLIIAAALYLPKCAAQTSLVVTLGSRHLGGGDFCEQNLGLGLEQGRESKRIVGFYKNSLCRTSVYAGMTYQPLQFANWRLGVVGIGVTGYEDPITLGAGLALTYDGMWNAIWFPNKKGDLFAGVIGVQYVRPF
jgi:hypothetical protein